MTRKTAASSDKNHEQPGHASERRSRLKSSLPPSASRPTATKGAKNMAENPIEEIAEASRKIAKDVELWVTAANGDAAISVTSSDIENRLAHINRLVDLGRSLWNSAERLEEEGAPLDELALARGEWENNVHQARDAFRDVSERKDALERMVNDLGAALSSTPPVTPLTPPIAQPIPSPLVPPRLTPTPPAVAAPVPKAAAPGRGRASVRRPAPQPVRPPQPGDGPLRPPR